MEISGGVGEVKIRMLLRDFDTAQLAGHAEVLRRAAEATQKSFPQVAHRHRHQAELPEHGRRA